MFDTMCCKTFVIKTVAVSIGSCYSWNKFYSTNSVGGSFSDIVGYMIDHPVLSCIIPSFFHILFLLKNGIC